MQIKVKKHTHDFLSRFYPADGFTFLPYVKVPQLWSHNFHVLTSLSYFLRKPLSMHRNKNVFYSHPCVALEWLPLFMLKLYRNKNAIGQICSGRDNILQSKLT